MLASLLWIAALLCAVPNANAQSAGAGATLYGSGAGGQFCNGCHGATPGKPQLNAASAASVLSHAIANNYGGAMGGFSTLSATDRTSIAMYFQQVLDANLPIAATVAYQGTSAAIPLNIDLAMGDITSVSYSSQTNGTVASTTNLTYTSPAGTANMAEARATFTHTASNCSDGSFTATGTGPGGTTSGRTVTVTVTPPAAPNLSTSATTSNATFNTLTAINTTNTGGPLASLSIQSGLSNGGSLTVNGTTGFNYTSSSTVYSATDSFTYRGTGPCGSNSANVTVNINIAAPQPDAPNTARAVAYETATVITLTGSVTNAVTGLTNLGTPSNGVLSGQSGNQITYTPNAGFIGADSFTYQTTGPGGTSAGTGTVSITVNAPGAPTITQPITLNVPYNAGGAAATTLALAPYITGPVASIAITSAPDPTRGSAVLNLPTSVNYTPVAGNLLSTSFQFTATAPGGATSAAATVTVNTTPPGAPTIQPKAISTVGNVPAVFDLAGDITGVYNSIAFNTFSNGGSANAVGSVVTYTPAADFIGTETFNYVVTAPGGANSTAVITATVSGPTSADRSVAVSYQTPTPIALTVGSGATILEVVTPPTKGSLSTPAAGVFTLTYTPSAGYTGADEFIYRSKGTGNVFSANSRVTITVSTQVPSAGDATMTVPLNTATTLDLAPYITGSGISGVLLAVNPEHGSVTVNGTKVTYTPANNYFGADFFKYVAYGNADSRSPTPGTVTVTVTGRPDPTRDATVTGLITAQGEAARRFSRAQVSNVQSRMESLHPRKSINAENSSDAGSGSGTASGFAAPRSITPAAAAARGYAPDAIAPVQQAPSRATGAAYKPAASLSADPAAGLVPAAPGSTAADHTANAVGKIAAALQATSGNGGAAAAIGKAVTVATAAAQSHSVTLAYSSGDGSTSAPGDVDIWAGGGVRYGGRDAGTATGSKFTSDGITVGVDKRFSEDLAAGVSFGFAKERTEIGTDGSLSDAKGYTIAAYASYQPMPNVFIDGMIGYGTLRFDNTRYVTPIASFAQSRRTGDYWFGSLAAGYEFTAPGLLISPYTRLDVASHRLHQATETGAGLYALTYASQRIPSVAAALGLRMESAHETDFGYISPRLRAEYQHDFKGAQAAGISYADLPGVMYYVSPTATSRNSLTVGLGSDFVFSRGLTLAVDYQMQRASATDTNQAFFIKLIKNLEGRNQRIPTYSLGGHGLGVNVDVGFGTDTNITRANTAPEVYEDQFFSMNINRPFTIPINDNFRVGLNFFAGAEKFKSFTGLDRFILGAEAELQYRASGEYGAPIYGLFARTEMDEYNSMMRDGHRLSFGISLRKPLTDRIAMFAALAKNSRSAHSDVFSTRDYSARMNFDYALTPDSTLYLTGEFRRGDIFSTGQHTLANVNIAHIFNRDDAFTRQGLYAYRTEGRTYIFTVGYNIPLGNKDSLDMSWRRVMSTVSTSTGLPGVNSPRYYTNQFSLIYLTSF